METTLTIVVIRCMKFSDITDGWKICHPSDDMRRGGRCRFGCYDGHRLRGDSSVTCQDSGQWTNEEQPFCESKLGKKERFITCFNRKALTRN